MSTRAFFCWRRLVCWLSVLAWMSAMPLSTAWAQHPADTGSTNEARARANFTRAFELLQQSRPAEALQPLMFGLGALGNAPAQRLAGRLEDAQLMQSAQGNRAPAAPEAASDLAQQLFGQALASAPQNKERTDVATLLETLYAAPTAQERERVLVVLQSTPAPALAQTLLAELKPPTPPAPAMASSALPPLMPATVDTGLPQAAGNAPASSQTAEIMAQRQLQAQQEAQRQQCESSCESQYEACAQAKSAQNTTATIGYLAGLFGGNRAGAIASAQTFTDKSECHAARRSCSAGCAAQLASLQSTRDTPRPPPTPPEERPSLSTQMTGTLLSAYGTKTGDGRLAAIGSTLQGKSTEQAVQDYVAVQPVAPPAAPVAPVTAAAQPLPQPQSLPPPRPTPIPPTPKRPTPEQLYAEQHGCTWVGGECQKGPLRLPPPESPAVSPVTQQPMPPLTQQPPARPQPHVQPRRSDRPSQPAERGDGTLNQGTPRRATVGTNPNNGCPLIIVQSRRPGSTDYNRRYPWTRVTYEGRYTSSATGEMVKRRDTVSVYMGSNDEGRAAPASLMNAGRQGLHCTNDEWYINIISTADTTSML